MTYQVIFNTAQSIEIDRRKIVGQTVSRSERIRTAERDSANALKFTVQPIARFRYSTNRDTIESIMNLDRFTEEQINIAMTANTYYLTQYQGQLTSGNLSSMTISTFTNNQVTFSSLPSVATSTVVFKAGDWIQPSLSRYPYIVSETVMRGSGSSITATVHRSLITSEATTVTGAFLVGTATTVRLVATQLPTVKLVQRDWAEFTGDFEFVESIR